MIVEEPKLGPEDTSLELFKQYSDPTRVFTFPSTTEASYPETAQGLTAKGGVYIGVVGGMESVFAQIVQADPDRIFLCDVNEYTISLAKLRIHLLDKAQDFDEYNEMYDSILKNKQEYRDFLDELSPKDANNIKEVIASTTAYSHKAIRDKDECGWGTTEEFNKLKKIVANTPITFVQEDVITFPGKLLDHGFISARDKIGVIYLSDILGWGVNGRRADVLLSDLRRFIDLGVTKEGAQVVDAANEKEKKVLGFESYIADLQEGWDRMEKRIEKTK